MLKQHSIRLFVFLNQESGFIRSEPERNGCLLCLFSMMARDEDDVGHLFSRRDYYGVSNLNQTTG